MVLSINTRLIFSVRHQDYSIESPVTATSPSSKSLSSITIPNESILSEEEQDESEEDLEYVHYSSAEIRKRYENQHLIFSKTIQENNIITSTPSNSPLPKKFKANTCSSEACLARKDVEAANTESIRKHILMKLGIDEAKLNHTTFPKLNEKIIESFCRNNKISPEICISKKTESHVEYQSDSPDFSSYDEFEDHFTSVEIEENVKFLSYENRIYAFPSSKY